METQNERLRKSRPTFFNKKGHSLNVDHMPIIQSLRLDLAVPDPFDYRLFAAWFIPLSIYHYYGVNTNITR